MARYIAVAVACWALSPASVAAEPSCYESPSECLSDCREKYTAEFCAGACAELACKTKPPNQKKVLQNGQIPGYKECVSRLVRTCPNCPIKSCCQEVGGDRFKPGAFPTCEKDVVEDSAKPTIQRDARVNAPVAPATDRVDVRVGRAPTLGSADAPVKVVVFAEFQCPFSKRLKTTLEGLREAYPGKLQVAYKHFPLPFHRDAELAAIASLAAHRQGQFWEMHDTLFANQAALQRDSLAVYARRLGLDAGKFQDDLEDPSLGAWVKSDVDEGARLGVKGTPTTFVNGRLVSGAQPLETFKALIEEELGK